MGHKKQNIEFIKPNKEKNYKKSLQIVLESQNEDGSWGMYEGEKVTLTSHGIQLMYSLGISKHNNKIKRAMKWLRDNVEYGDEHWSTRLELGLLLGSIEEDESDGSDGPGTELCTNSEIDRYITDLRSNLAYEMRNDNTYWNVIPFLIALLPYEKEMEIESPHKEIIEYIEKQYIFPDANSVEYISVQRKPNNTGLAALYLTKLSENSEIPESARNEYKKKSEKMFRWLLMSVESSEQDYKLHWSGSCGVTAYVLMDLIRAKKDNEQFQEMIFQIVNYIAPDKNGLNKNDSVKTFNSALHGCSSYVNMLVLRAITEVFKTYYPKKNLRKFLNLPR